MYVAKGIFRFITGKIAEAKPENVEINVPSGTIGIRGTIVVGEIEGERCLISLEAEEGKEKVRHRVVVSSRVDGKLRKVEIQKPGFATVIEGRGQRPKRAFRLPAPQRQRFQQTLPRPRFLPRGPDGPRPPERHQPFGNRELRERPGEARGERRQGQGPSAEKRPARRPEKMNRREEARSERPREGKRRPPNGERPGHPERQNRTQGPKPPQR